MSFFAELKQRNVFCLGIAYVVIGGALAYGDGNRSRRMNNLLVMLAVLPLFATAYGAEPRARDLGIPFEGTPGAVNAITDVTTRTVGVPWRSSSALVATVVPIFTASIPSPSAMNRRMPSAAASA